MGTGTSTATERNYDDYYFDDDYADWTAEQFQRVTAKSSTTDELVELVVRRLDRLQDKLRFDLDLSNLTSAERSIVQSLCNEIATQAYNVAGELMKKPTVAEKPAPTEDKTPF